MLSIFEPKKILYPYKMYQDITDFLPIYPNINQLDDDIFNPYTDNFYEDIYRKDEFYENKLSAVEDFPEVVGTLMKNQKLIARFFSSRTLYDQLLLVHAMGSGKGCTAIGAVEQIKSEGGGFKGAIYVAKGEALLQNFMNELVFKCTDGRYIPEDYNELTELEKVHRTKKLIKEYYTLNTFETFAKKIKTKTDEQLQNEYNNHIIIIDEVHNLRVKDTTTDKGINMYSEFHRLLHTVKDCKILLMSGTPMKDGVEEISSVMNLLLPLDEQLPYGEEFVDKFFNKTTGGVLKVKSTKVDTLKSVFKGRVSFLVNMQSDIKKVFMGDLTGDLKYLKVVEDFMGKFQSDVYKTAYELDKGDRKGVYSNSRQASLFVFPDGSYGDTGFKKYISATTTTKKGQELLKNVQRNNYNITSILAKELDGVSVEEKLKKLQKFSSKYAESIKLVLEAQKEGKCMFIYNEYVKGSGLILFGFILEMFGFKKATGNETDKSFYPRYASLTSETASDKQLTDLVNRFNKPDNMNGKVINIIMGSRKISEGFSFKNIQIEDIHTPWYNYSETSQAIARGVRLGSHRQLIEAGIIPTVDIYQRVSIPSNRVQSIDLDMYQISEIKDVSIKGVERILKVSAWDCGLAYDRNHVTKEDGERECDYTKCDYKCEGISDFTPAKQDLDYSTFDIYYNREVIDKIIENIKILFRTHFRLDLNSITDYLHEFSEFQIITALHEIINKSIQFINKYGFLSYMKEENNIFFLVDSLSVSGQFSSDYYTEFPNISTDITFNKVVQPLYLASLPGIVEQIENAKNLNDIRKLMVRLPLEIHEELIESSILARKKNIKKNESVRNLILEYFVNSYAEIDGTWVSWLLYDDNEILRCLDGSVWKDCTEEFAEKVEKSKQTLQLELEQNPYGYYGQYNKESGDFCIRDVQETPTLKKHTKTSGKRCTNWPKESLIPVILDKLKITTPVVSNLDKKELDTWTKIQEMKKDTLLKEISKNKYVKDRANKSLSQEKLANILFWGKLQIKPTCSYMYKWFDSNKLLVEDTNCGKMGKIKI